MMNTENSPMQFANVVLAGENQLGVNARDVHTAQCCIEQTISALKGVQETIKNIQKLSDELEVRMSDESFFNFLGSLPSRSEPEKKYKTYIIQDVDNGDIKVGKSENPNSRISIISLASGRNLEIVTIIDEDVELELHEKFSKFRTIGEWFKLPICIVKALNETKPKLMKELDALMHKMQPSLNFLD